MTDTLILLRATHYNGAGLTPLGVSETVSIANKLRTAKINPGLILHSRHPQDVETASTIIELYKAMGAAVGRAKVDENLDSHRYRVKEALSQSEKIGTVVIVSSQTDIQNAISCFLNYSFRGSDAPAFLMESVKATSSSPRTWRLPKEIWPSPVP